MQSPPTYLKAYLPAVSLRDVGEMSGPSRRGLLASCLWLDMSGFTPLTERLSAEGPEGIERLSETLNQLYAAVANVAAATGGDVMFFAGDGALCLWEAADPRALGATTWLAASASQRLLAALTPSSTEGYRFSMRQVVVTGELMLDTVGGDQGTWSDVVSGAPLQALAELGKACRIGHVSLSERAVAELGARASVSRSNSGFFELVSLFEDSNEAVERAGHSAQVPLTAVAAAKIPGFLSTQLSQAQLPPSELRRVSVAFLQLETLDLSATNLHALALALQQAARRHHGWLCQLVQDDKGLTGLVVFGLPGHAQGEDGVRAVRFASDVSRQIEALGLAVRLGVATGPAFCGVCGGQGRLQYCVLGTAVNRAARLAEQSPIGPLVDEQTFMSAHWRVDFMHHASLRLKGMQSVVEAYRPGATREVLLVPTSAVAFEAERAQVGAWLADFLTGGDNRPLLVLGELGAGKTAFLTQIPALASELGAELQLAACDEFEQYSGYFALRPVMRRLLGNAQQADEVEWLRAKLAERGQEEQLSLLNPLLFADFPMAPLVQQMSPETRAENRKQMVVQLLRDRLNGRQVVIVIDDAHWLDASSLELVLALRAQLTNLSFILAERVGEAGSVQKLQDARVLAMKPLDVAAVGQLVARLSAAPLASAELSQAIWRSSRGNPLHCTELVRALLSSGRVEVVADQVQIKAGSGDELLEVAGTLEELIQGRFDRLSEVARHMLRTASVLGVSLDLAVLREVLATRMQPHELDAALDEALQFGILRSRGTHQFEHATIQAVVYRLLLPREQRHLHERVAQALEGLHAAKLEAVAARLAHHWMRAGNAQQAAHFSALAADQALQGYANPDAEHLFRQAIEQDTAFRGVLPISHDRGRWSMLMAQALYSQSRHVDARQAYDAALRWSGMAPPRGLGSLPLTILGLLFRVMLGKLGRQSPVLAQGEARQRQLLSIRIINAGLALDVWQGRLFEAANKAFIAYRLSEHVGDTPEAAETIAGLGYLLSSTPARRYAEPQLQRAIRAADATGDLQARTSSRVLLGMHYALCGQSPDAEAPLLVAQSLAERLGSGLWRHRACFGLGEALLCNGRLQAASVAFVKASELAALAEPPVEGFANCMAAVAVSRGGQQARAIELALGARGLPLVAGDCLVLQRFTSLGIAAELLFGVGRRQEAKQLADQALELSRQRRDVNVFFAAVHGHTGITLVYLGLLEAAAHGDEAERRRLQRQAAAAIAQLGAFSRMYPAAQAAFELLRGRYFGAKRRRRRALAAFTRAAEHARRTQQPFEQSLAHYWLASTTQGAVAVEQLAKFQALQAQMGTVLTASAWQGSRAELHAK